MELYRSDQRKETIYLGVCANYAILQQKMISFFPPFITELGHLRNKRYKENISIKSICTLVLRKKKNKGLFRNQSIFS